MRLQEQMGGPRLGLNPVPLEPFGHQVAGQASMLWVDPVTVCKPLIAREHHLYCTLPPQLVPFTPQYKGVLFVRLVEEEDGRINLWGSHCDETTAPGPDLPLPVVQADNCLPVPVDLASDEERGYEGSSQSYDDRYLQPLQFDWSSGTSTPLSSSSEMDLIAAVESEQSSVKSMSRPPSSGCIVRVKQDGEYEIQNAKAENRFIVASDDETSQPPIIQTQALNPWGQSLHTRLLDKMRKSNMSASGCPFLMLENVVACFQRPCILDLKVGSRLHGDGASSKKMASQTHKCSTTTSRTLGLRLCGMQVFQETTGAYKSLDKYFGRTLNDDSFYSVLREFLHNGSWLREELLTPILVRLRSLHSCLQQLDSFRFYASSLLIMYDGDCSSFYVEQSTLHTAELQGTSGVKKSDEGTVTVSCPCASKRVWAFKQSLSSSSSLDTLKAVSPGQSAASLSTSSSGTCKEHPSPPDAVDSSSSGQNRACQADICSTAIHESEFPASVDKGQPLVDVRMIDFAHTTHKGFHDDIVHEGPDRDYLWGLGNLIGLFEQLQREYS